MIHVVFTPMCNWCGHNFFFFFFVSRLEMVSIKFGTALVLQKAYYIYLVHLIERMIPTCSQTLINFLKKESGFVFEQMQVEFIRYLLQGKWLNLAKNQGYYVVAIDATVKDRKYNRMKDPVTGSQKCRYMLEAKIITPWEWALSVVSEPIAPYNTESEKQDSEYNGFLRLAPRLKEALKGYGVCIIGDTLYQTQKMRALCDDYGWKYIFTAKEGRAPKLMSEYYLEMNDHPENSGSFTDSTPNEQIDLRWADGEYARSQIIEYKVDCKVVEIKAINPRNRENVYYGAFITNFDIPNKDAALKVANWGRLRWNIEISFRTEKTLDLVLNTHFL